jgi:hypothetical protein
MSAERGPKPQPRLDLSGRAWKLGLTALLGAAFAASWLAIAEPAPTPAPQRPLARAPRVTQVRRVVQRTPRARIRTRSS